MYDFERPRIQSFVGCLDQESREGFSAAMTKGCSLIVFMILFDFSLSLCMRINKLELRKMCKNNLQNVTFVTGNSC